MAVPFLTVGILQRYNVLFKKTLCFMLAKHGFNVLHSMEALFLCFPVHTFTGMSDISFIACSLSPLVSVSDIREISLY